MRVQNNEKFIICNFKEYTIKVIKCTSYTGIEPPFNNLINIYIILEFLYILRKHDVCDHFILLNINFVSYLAFLLLYQLHIYF